MPRAWMSAGLFTMSSSSTGRASICTNGFAAAGLASQALLDQVFSDSPSGNFDAVPGLATGCDGLVECIELTPFERPSLVILDVLVSEMLNSVQETGDFLLSLESWDVGQDTTFDQSVVFVVWSPSPNPPPRSF